MKKIVKSEDAFVVLEDNLTNQSIVGGLDKNNRILLFMPIRYQSEIFEARILADGHLQAGNSYGVWGGNNLKDLVKRLNGNGHELFEFSSMSEFFKWAVDVTS